ncbi:MAG: hypothetical protein SXQ77_05220, partial [Halobacteria archaeon]|nr:hypothetical protein [Halobacteria archaeon]
MGRSLALLRSFSSSSSPRLGEAAVTVIVLGIAAVLILPMLNLRIFALSVGVSAVCCLTVWTLCRDEGEELVDVVAGFLLIASIWVFFGSVYWVYSTRSVLPTIYYLVVTVAIITVVSDVYIGLDSDSAEDILSSVVYSLGVFLVLAVVSAVLIYADSVIGAVWVNLINVGTSSVYGFVGVLVGEISVSVFLYRRLASLLPDEILSRSSLFAEDEGDDHGYTEDVANVLYFVYVLSFPVSAVVVLGAGIAFGKAYTPLSAVVYHPVLVLGFVPVAVLLVTLLGLYTARKLFGKARPYLRGLVLAALVVAVGVFVSGIVAPNVELFHPYFGSMAYFFGITVVELMSVFAIVLPLGFLGISVGTQGARGVAI